MNYLELTVSELKSYCADRGIEVSGDRRKKQSYITAIELNAQEVVLNTAPQFKRELVATKIENPPMVLTVDQSEALAKIQEFVKSSNEKCFRLSGFAGTGKSYLVAALIQWLKKIEVNFVAAAPTNKAVKNIENLAREAGMECDCCTVAVLLGQQPSINQETGKEEFVSSHNGSTIGHYSVVVIDEFSMVSKGDFDEILAEILGSKTKVIFVGDDAQLPPVGEREPIVAQTPIIRSAATLSTIVRYDGAIAKVAEEIRSNATYADVMYPFETTEDKTVVHLQDNEWQGAAIKLFKSKEFKANPDLVRILVWRNKIANYWNNIIHNAVWGANAKAYEIGDRLIAKTPVFRKAPGARDFKIVMGNSTEATVIGEAELKTCSRNKWEYYNVPVVTDEGRKLDLILLTDKGEAQRQGMMNALKNKRRWREFYTVLKSYDNCPFAYAITTHKAQGSTINHVFIDTNDMRGCSDRQKMLYTALTRTKVRAYIPK